MVFRAESLLCLWPLSALCPEPRSKVILLSLREPWPKAWVWLPGQLFRDGLVPAQMPVSSPPLSMAHSRLPRCHIAAASSCLSRDPISPSLAFRHLHIVVSLQRSPSGQPAQPPGDRHPEHFVGLLCRDADFSHIRMAPTLGLLIVSLKLGSLSWAGCLPHIWPSQCIPESKSALVLSSRPDPPFPRLPHLSKYQLQPEMWGTSLAPSLPHVTH